MCHLYVSADPILYESRTRSLRIHGMATSIRLENLFWDVLAGIALEDGMTTNQLIIKLHDEVLELRGDLPNLASFLRVSCMRHLAPRMEVGQAGEGQPVPDGKTRMRFVPPMAEPPAALFLAASQPRPGAGDVRGA